MSGEKPEEQYIIANGIVKKKDSEKYLLVKRKREWDDQSHGKWELPGGKVDFGENPQETAMREVKEEAGFHVKNPELLDRVFSHVWEYDTRKSQVVILPYRCELAGGESDTSDKNISDLGWFTLQEIKGKDCLPGTVEMIEQGY